MFAVNTCAFSQCFHAESDLIPRAPTDHLIPDPVPHKVHLTPIALRAGGQSPDLISPANRDQNQVLLSKGQDLVVQDTAVVAGIAPGHNLPDPGEAHIYILHFF